VCSGSRVTKAMARAYSTLEVTPSIEGFGSSKTVTVAALAGVERR